MESVRRPPGVLSNEKLWHGAVFLIIVIPFFLNLGASSLWDANESFYAETPREMLESGDFLAPQFNYQPRTQKPPLAYWPIALAYAVLGVNEFAVRLPGALAAVGFLAFTYFSARLLHSPRAALITLIVTGTTIRIFILARRLPIDILLLFFLAATGFFLMRGLLRDSDRSWALAYVFCGLGFLTKGPVAAVIPFGAYLAWALWSRTFRIRQMRLHLGAVLLAAVILPWYAAIYLRSGWTYIAPFFLRDNLERFAGQLMGPSRGPFYYAGAYLADYFPWSLLSLAALICLWLERRSEPILANAAWGFPLVWSALVVVIFTLSKNKQEYYIAPVYPMMSMTLGGIIDRLSNSGNRRATAALRRTWRFALFAASALFLGAAAVIPLALGGFLPQDSIVLKSGPSVLILLGVAAVTRSALRGHIVAPVALLGATCWLLLLFASLFILPAVESLRPVKSICAGLNPLLVPGDEVGYYRATVPSMAFYLRRPIFEEFDADRIVDRLRSEKRVYCVLGGEDHDYLVGQRGLTLHVLERRPRLVTRLRDILESAKRLRQELLLVSNRPAATKSDGTRPGTP